MSIYLRELEVADANKLLEIRIRNRDFFQMFEPIKKESHFTLEEQEYEIKRNNKSAQDDLAYILGIFLSDNNTLIGRISLTGITRGPFQNANLGYYIDKLYCGKGYATKAIEQICDYAFEKLALHRIQAGVMPSNVASIHVLEKAGFRKEGLALNYLEINGKWEDHYLFAKTFEDYEKANRSNIKSAENTY